MSTLPEFTITGGGGEIELAVAAPATWPFRTIDLEGKVSMLHGQSLPEDLRQSIEVVIGVSSWGNAMAYLDCDGRFLFKNVRLEEDGETDFVVTAAGGGQFALLKFAITCVEKAFVEDLIRSLKATGSNNQLET